MKGLIVNCILASIIILAISSCKKETDTYTSEQGYNYFPYDSGVYVIYKIDSTIFDDFTGTKRVAVKYLKEKMTEHFTDNLGRDAIRIERYYADSIPSSWQLFNVFYAVKTNKVVERVEDNLRYLRLIFPNDRDNQWLGNKFISSPPPYIIDTSNYRVQDWLYTIKEKDVPYANAFQSFDSSLLVYHIYDSSAINKTYSIERYARNVGLVYKEFWIVAGQTNIGLPWEDRAQKGFILRQYIVDYGKE